MNKAKANETVQSNFLNTLTEEGIPVTLITKNGFQMKGVVKFHDQYTIVLEVNGNDTLINKVAISTIIASKRVPI
ncbi:RNA chaperone Hfq [Paenibacillus ehimensis]|uniref:RNA chaperone Hfq n=1 Tax=Paenibacillus ehimensis TaxID=79264 RepID=A0ABT8VE41_9BACL|nr:RNA chaperone Hfq [Paenibacillus ehimensis]MDO3679239.1 RNA chaperone Hfq [Paenibacillus ehimensis]MEC0207863.1 RNA chaperone Hfq [Paenibacillus ehimensis]